MFRTGYLVNGCMKFGGQAAVYSLGWTNPCYGLRIFVSLYLKQYTNFSLHGAFLPI
uniref:Uncharacterized protein n=1 Tax=Arundo donax TaxID=35708 RepID=A0A0A9CIG7_ARUDO